MHSRLSIFLVCLLASSTCGRGVPRYVRHATVEERDGPPPLWTKRARADARDVLPVRIALRQSNLHKAEEFIMDVAGPGSPSFGQHWSAKQIADTFAPSQEAVDEVLAWLCGADSSLCTDPDLISLSPSRGWLTFDATVMQVESLLKTTYHVYQHDRTGAGQLASGSYSVPEEIREHIDFITPTLHFTSRAIDPRHRKQKRQSLHKSELPRELTAATALGAISDSIIPQSQAKKGSEVHGFAVADDLSTCDTIITPDCVRALYGIPTTPITAVNNSLGIAEYTPNTYLQSDLDMFFTNYSSNLVGTSPTFVSIDGGPLANDYDDVVEADLDLEYAMVLTQPLTPTVYEVGDLIETGSFDNFLDAIDGSYCTYDGGDPTVDPQYPDPSTAEGSYTSKDCGTTPPPLVISSSYDFAEVQVTFAYADRQCYEYMKLGLLGVTVLYSSGDYGVATDGGYCIDNHGITNVFAPGFPSVCPYVTSVGGTQINPGASVDDPEVAVSTVVYSGGGFSNNFLIPSWQKTTLANWWATYPPSFSFQQFNNSQKTRGYPDISANAANYIIASDGSFGLIYGTSASAPVVASLITHINDELLNAGKGPVGFLNPVLYAHPEVLNDITSGSNPGCSTNGFNATVGWDPVTGLGTPNYQKMRDLYMSL